MKLWAYLGELERVPTNLPVTSPASEGLIESLPKPPTYKHQEHYLCFDHDFDIEDAATYTSLDDEEDGCDDDSIDESISASLYRHAKSRG